MKALIIGGGLAGAAAALALHKADIECEIFEARASSDEEGAFVTLAVNGVIALDLLGVDAAKVAGIDTPRMQLLLSDGHRLAEFPLGPVLPGGRMTRTVKRAALSRALLDQVRAAGIPISYGKKVTDATPTGGRVTALFDDGTSASGDLLIGADGVHSRVRKIIDPGAPQPRYLGVLNTGGFARGVDVPDAKGAMQMLFGKRTFFSYLADGQGGAWWFANPELRREPARGELAAIAPQEWRRRVRELVADDAGPATQIIDATDELFAPWATYDFPSVPLWHRDRMVIIGDAAHAASPSSGQGASMAFEDAAALALALRDARDIPTAFSVYEQARRPRVRRIVAQGKRSGTGKTPGPLGRSIRDLFLRLVFARPPRESDQTWLYGYRIDWENGFAVHDAGVR